MKKMYYLFPIVVFLLMIGGLGCGARFTTSSEKTMIENVDPFQYGDEFAVPVTGTMEKMFQTPVLADSSVIRNDRPKVSKAHVLGTERAVSDSVAGSQNLRGDQKTEETVYRAQIGVFEDQKSAEKLAQDARDKVSEKVYVEFEPPFYRVRVGDFTTRKEAESYVKTLQNMGFRGSFWVMKRTAVR